MWLARNPAVALWVEYPRRRCSCNRTAVPPGQRHDRMPVTAVARKSIGLGFRPLATKVSRLGRPRYGFDFSQLGRLLTLFRPIERMQSAPGQRLGRLRRFVASGPLQSRLPSRLERVGPSAAGLLTERREERGINAQKTQFGRQDSWLSADT